MNYFLPRLRAAGFHFLLSIIVVGAVVATAIGLWFPGYLARAAGLVGLTGILISVDLILGPALTFLVYRPGKKSLRFDLTVIAAIQISALVFGISSIYQVRPVYLAFVVDRFETVAAADLEESLLREAAEPYRAIPVDGPKVVGVELPIDPAELENLTMAEALNGTGPALIPRYYRDYASVVSKTLSKARSLDALHEFNAANEVSEAVAGLGRDPAVLRFLPLAGRDRDLTVIVEAETGAIVEIVDLRPWRS